MNRGPAAKLIPVPIENQSGEDIPPFSVVLVTGVVTSADGLHTWSTVTQYDGTSGNIMVTGHVTTPATMTYTDGTTGNGRGTAFYDDFLYVAVDDAEDDPVAGETWGPVSGQWTLGPNGTGFSCQGYSLQSGVTPKRALFYRAGSGSSSGAQMIQFAISEIVCEGDTIQSITGTVTDIGCGATEPTVGDTVDLVDVMSLAVGYPPSLVGRTGVAMKQEQAGGGAYPTDCSWVIWNLEAGYVECS